MQVWYWFGCGMVWVFACWHNLCVRVGLLIFFLIFVSNLVIKGVWTAFGYWFNLAIDGCLLWPSGILINSKHKKNWRGLCVCVCICVQLKNSYESLPCSEWVRERERKKERREGEEVGGEGKREGSRRRERAREREKVMQIYICM